ncbi:MAG: peptidoglycan editing factor PgeF [Acidobacteriota bacterium]
MFRFTELERFPDFTHGFTCRQAGWSDVETGLRAAEILGIPGRAMLLLQQVHSSRTVLLDAGVRPAARRLPGILGPADGVVVRGGWFPVIRTADCIPVLAVAPEERAVGFFHAGWRGVCDRLVTRGLSLMSGSLGVDPRRVVVALGPSIRRCCYPVGEDVIARFQAAGHDLDRLLDRDRLDLVEAVRLQAESAGVREILDSGMCTSCRTDLFPSYRAERTRERMWTIGGFREAAAGREPA